MAGRVIPDLRTGYRFVANGEIKMPGTIEGDTTQRGHIQIIEDHDIKFVNGGKISNVSTVNGINLSNWKSDYDSKIDQNVKFDSSPQFGDLKVASVVCPNYPGDGTGLFNTVDIKAFKADYDLKVNQNVKTSSTPSFAGLTVGTVGYPTARSTTGYVLTQGEDGDVHFEQPNTTLPGRITLASGTAGEPAYSWSIDDSSGIYYDNGTAISRGGIKRVWLDNSGFNVDDDVTLNGALTLTGHTVTVRGNIDTASSFTTSGDNALTLTTTNATNVTLPTSGTLVNTTTTDAILAKQLPILTDISVNGITITAATTGSGVAGTSPTKGSPVDFDSIRGYRNGRWLHLHYEYRQGTGGTAGSGEYLFALPDGYTIDTSYQSINNNVASTTSDVSQSGLQPTVIGYGHIGNNSSRGPVTAFAYDSTHFRLGAISAFGAYAMMGSSHFPLSGSNLAFGVNIIVPTTLSNTQALSAF